MESVIISLRFNAQEKHVFFLDVWMAATLTGDSNAIETGGQVESPLGCRRKSGKIRTSMAVHRTVSACFKPGSILTCLCYVICLAATEGIWRSRWWTLPELGARTGLFGLTLKSAVAGFRACDLRGNAGWAVPIVPATQPREQSQTLATIRIDDQSAITGRLDLTGRISNPTFELER